MKRPFAVCMLVLGFLGANAQEASAQLKIFMKVDGIPGSSLDQYHRNWIEAQSLRQSQAPDAPKNNPCQVEVVKGLDIAGPRLWHAAVQERHIKDAAIEVVTTGSLQFKIYEILLHEVRIVGLTTEGSDAFVERVTLVADSVSMSYWQVQPDGTVGGVITEDFRCN